MGTIARFFSVGGGLGYRWWTVGSGDAAGWRWVKVGPVSATWGAFDPAHAHIEVITLNRWLLRWCDRSTCACPWFWRFPQ